MNSTRLSYDELMYLCVSLTKAKEIYGLTPKSAEVKIDWADVRSGLIDKGLLIKDGESLQIRPQLAYMISALGAPKMFISVSKPTDSQACCIYLTRHFALRLVKDKNAEHQYLLSPCHTSEDVYRALDDMIQWEPSTHSPSAERASFTLDEYETYLKTLRTQRREEHDAILAGQGFSDESICDVFETLSGKNYWLTMVMLSFDPRYSGGRQVVEQTVIYKGLKHLWAMEIAYDGAHIFCTGHEAMKRKLEVISSLFKYF